MKACVCSAAAATRLEEELLAARQELQTTQTLMEEIRGLRIDIKQQPATAYANSQHHSHNTSAVVNHNNNNNSGSFNCNLTQHELDKLLDRYDGFVP